MWDGLVFRNNYFKLYITIVFYYDEDSVRIMLIEWKIKLLSMFTITNYQVSKHCVLVVAYIWHFLNEMYF